MVCRQRCGNPLGGGGIRDAKYFLFRLKNIYALTQGFTLEPRQRYVAPAGTVNEDVSEVLVSMPLLMLALQ